MRLAASRTVGGLALLGFATLAAGACDEWDDVSFFISSGDVDFDDDFDGGGLVIVVVDDDDDDHDDDDDDRSGPDVVNRPGLRVPWHASASWSGSFDAGRSGDLVVAVALEDARGGSSPIGRVALERIPGWTWTVHVHGAPGDPLRGCPGCSHHRVLPLPPAAHQGPAKSLVIAWGGSSSRVALLD